MDSFLKTAPLSLEEYIKYAELLDPPTAALFRTFAKGLYRRFEGDVSEKVEERLKDEIATRLKEAVEEITEIVEDFEGEMEVILKEPSEAQRTKLFTIAFKGITDSLAKVNQVNI